MPFDTNLIPNHIIAFATVAVFLFCVTFAVVNAETLIDLVEVQDPKTALVMGGIGGTLVTALLLNVRDIYQFFFRKTPSTT